MGWGKKEKRGGMRAGGLGQFIFPSIVHAVDNHYWCVETGL